MTVSRLTGKLSAAALQKNHQSKAFFCSIVLVPSTRIYVHLKIAEQIHCILCNLLYPGHLRATKMGWVFTLS